MRKIQDIEMSPVNVRNKPGHLIMLVCYGIVCLSFEQYQREKNSNYFMECIAMCGWSKTVSNLYFGITKKKDVQYFLCVQNGTIWRKICIPL